MEFGPRCGWTDKDVTTIGGIRGKRRHDWSEARSSGICRQQDREIFSFVRDENVSTQQPLFLLGTGKQNEISKTHSMYARAIKLSAAEIKFCGQLQKGSVRRNHITD